MTDYLWLLIPIPTLLVIAFREWLRHMDRQLERRNRDELMRLEAYSRQLAFDEDYSAYLRLQLGEVERMHRMEEQA